MLIDKKKNTILSVYSENRLLVILKVDYMNVCFSESISLFIPRNIFYYIMIK